MGKIMTNDITPEPEQTDERLEWETPKVIQVDRASVQGGASGDDEAWASRLS